MKDRSLASTDPRILGVKPGNWKEERLRLASLQKHQEVGNQVLPPIPIDGSFASRTKSRASL